jgi:hypothetical protein
MFKNGFWELKWTQITKMPITLYIANREFGGLRKLSAIYQHRQIVDLAFKNE